MGKGGFSQARRSVEQSVLHGFGAFFGGGKADLKRLLDFLLADEFSAGGSPKGVEKFFLVGTFFAEVFRSWIGFFHLSLERDFKAKRIWSSMAIVSGGRFLVACRASEGE